MFKLPTPAEKALQELVTLAMKNLRAPITANQELVADIYTGRSPAGTQFLLPEGGVSLSDMAEITANLGYEAPDTTANLFLSRLRQIVVGTTPGHPNFDISALIPGAQHQVDAQQRITDMTLRQTNIDDVFERAAFLGPTQNFFGIRLIPKPGANHVLDKLSFEAVESTHCGYEPFGRRFEWHTYQMQWGDLPVNQRPPIEEASRVMNPWDVVTVTEVYHKKLSLGITDEQRKDAPGEYPMSIFVQVEGDMWKRRRKTPLLGVYVGTRFLVAPVLVIDRYLDAAPNEDVPPAEVASWIPLMRQIVAVLVKVTEEIKTTNHEILYDAEAVTDAALDLMRRATGKVYIPVQVNDLERGVNSTVRPVERNSIVSDALQVLSTLITLFDDVTGVGPIDRGMPTNPEKSATEAANLTAAAGLRNQDRMRVLARAWGKIAELTFRWQKTLYGENIEVIVNKEISKNFEVPSAETARFAFKVDVAELANKARARQINTLMTAHTLLVNDATNLQDPNALRMVAESRRRLLTALGWVDADQFSGAIFGQTGPEERYMELLETGNPIPVYEDDKHEAYIGAYMRLITRAQKTANSEIPVAALNLAVQEHSLLLQQQQAKMTAGGPQNPSTVPGMGSDGSVDNQSAASLNAGLEPEQSPQTVA